MKNQQGAPEALAHELFTAAQLAPGEGISDAVARIAALVEAQQPAPSAAAAEIVELLECSGCLKVGQKDRALAIVARLLTAQHGGVL